MEYTLLDYKTSFYRIFTHGLEASEAVEDEIALVLCGEPPQLEEAMITTLPAVLH